MTTHQVPTGTVAQKRNRKAAAKSVEVAPAIRPEITEEQREAERREEDRRESERRATAQADAAMAFTTMQLSKGPEPTLAAPEAAQAEYKQKLEELQKRYNIQPTPAKASAKNQRNGITRPGDGTTTGKVWAAADQITIAKGRPAAIAEVKLHASLIGVNDHTIKTQYARWRQYNDVHGRVSAADVPKATGEYEGLTPQ